MNNNVYIYNFTEASTENVIEGCKKFIMFKDNIYYIDMEDRINKYNLLSHEQTQVSGEKASTFNIYDSYIFYVNLNDSEYLYRMGLTGESPVLI